MYRWNIEWIQLHNFIVCGHPICKKGGHISLKKADQEAHADDRNDNYEKLENKVEDTLANYAEAEERLEWAPEHEKPQIEAKNERRQQAVEQFRNEMEDEK